jgi:predicted nucleic acid-binding protein
VAIRGILLDTNAYAAFKRNVPDAIDIIRQAPLIAINSVVLGELLGGFAVGSREATNRQELNLFLSSSRVRLYAVDADTAAFYATVYLNLRKKGPPLPTNDMWIAATAMQHGMAVFTYDKHLQAVDSITAGNRLADFIT